jgi:hypothetical protein
MTYRIRQPITPAPEDLVREDRLGEVIDGADPINEGEWEMAATVWALRGDPFPDPPAALVASVVAMARSAPLPAAPPRRTAPGVLLSWARRRLGRARERGERQTASERPADHRGRVSRSAIVRRLRERR